MTERTATREFDPYAESEGETGATAEQPADTPVVEGDRLLPSSTAEAIARATAGLGDDDGKR